MGSSRAAENPRIRIAGATLDSAALI